MTEPTGTPAPHLVDRALLIRLAVVVAVPMALVALIPAAVGLGIEWSDRARLERTVNGQRALIEQIVAVRRAQILQISESDFKLCSEIEKLKRQIRVTVARSNKTLPTLAYYREHPDELTAALNYNGQVMLTFRASSCARLPTQNPPTRPQPPPAATTPTPTGATP